MRLLRSHVVSTATIITSLLSVSSFVAANPLRLASDSPLTELANALDIRQCANPCGWQGQYCCTSDETCHTENDIATCKAGAAQATPAAGGNLQLFTTVYVTTEEVPKTITNVYSLHTAAGATVTVTVFGSQPTAATCNVNLGQIQCGITCCAQGQFCNSGVCLANGATTGGSGPVATVSVSAPIRPTSISTYTVITTNGATSTVPFLMPATATAAGNGTASASTSGSSLSGGAIAGIVIGVLAGIIILILLIICCCARGLLDLIRPKRKTEVTEIYEGHHHAGGAPPKRRFGIFGGGGGNNRPSDGKKGWLGVAGVLAAIALVLGLKRKRDERHDEKASTAYTYSEYTYDYSTSASSESSDDRRTRNTRSDRRSSRR